MRLAERNLVSLIWIPGRTEVQGNEIADQQLVLKAKINNDTDKKHIQYWKNLLVCQHSKLFLKEPLGAPARNIFNMNKRRLRTLVGTVTGHFSCNYHLNNLGLRQTKMCDRCHLDKETMYHLVCRCPSLSSRRYRMLGNRFQDPQEHQKLQLTKIVDLVSPLFA
jgi:hypothetical protein